MPIPDLYYALAVTLALAAVVAWLVARLTLARWIHRTVGEVASRPAQRASEQSVRCGMCGEAVAGVQGGIEHVDEVHGLRIGREDAETVLTGVGSDG